MITAVAQTLANLLTKGSPLLSTVQIDLSHPSKRSDVRPALSLYLYDLRQSMDQDDLNSQRRVGDNFEEIFWFDLSFVIIAWDWTNIGQQHLLSETLQLLLSHPILQEDDLDPQLRGYGDLPVSVATVVPDVMAFWNALKVPLQPAVYITIKTPFPR
jgi:hypothetical protein